MKWWSVLLAIFFVGCDDQECFEEFEEDKPECEQYCVSEYECDLGHGLVLDDFSCENDGVCCEPQETPCTGFQCNTPPKPHCVRNHYYQGQYYDAVQHYYSGTCKFNEYGTAWCEYHVETWEVCVGNGSNGRCEDGRCIYKIPPTENND